MPPAALHPDPGRDALDALDMLGNNGKPVRQASFLNIQRGFGCGAHGVDWISFDLQALKIRNMKLVPKR
jgi:hypothetical protein